MNEPGRIEVPETTSPTTTTSTRKRRSNAPRRSSSRRSRRGLRAVYFCLASIWGFVTGTGAVLLGLGASGQHSSLGTGGRALIAGAALVAVLGGAVAATAYRAASRRNP